MGSAGSGNSQGVKGLLGNGDRFGQDLLLQRGLCSCVWEAHAGSCRGGSLRGVSVSCCCHSRRGVDVAPPWAAPPSCVRVPSLFPWQSRAFPRRLLAPSLRYHLTVKSCHSILGVFEPCPGSAGCSKVEIKANLLLWLRKTLVTSALILSEEIRDVPVPWSGDGRPGSALCHAAVLMLIYTSW